jgi:2-keto-4-pentenoate hydratase/2-oxohepta-3-ene-1,7-dioic acid hydratase in catechol pathway
MKLASFSLDGRNSFGIAEGDNLRDIGEIFAERYADLKALIAAQAYEEIAAARRQAKPYPLEAITWLPLVERPAKILCVGHNYESHRLETGRAKTGYPSIFTRFADTLTAHNAPIIRPSVSTMLDYEGELAVIIGKSGRHISEINAMSHIAGVTCANDASVRDWQWHTQQFTPGKNFPKTAALGPWLVTPDEISDLEAVTVTTRLNGNVMQHAPLANLIFPLPVIIAYVSTFTALEPGDIILTGTPGGVGAKREPPVWMQDGDVVEIEISSIGLLKNNIAPETATGDAEG